MTATCSFCGRPATTHVDDPCDIMPACRPCAEDWALNPGFLLPASCDRSGEAVETGNTGSTEGESAVPEGQTPNLCSSHSTEERKP